MDLAVKTLTGATYVLEGLSEHMSVAELARVLHTRTQTPPRNQRLVFRGRRLLHSELLKDVGFAGDGGDVVYLVLAMSCKCCGTFSLPKEEERRSESQVTRLTRRAIRRHVRSLVEQGVTPLLERGNEVHVELCGVGELHFQMGDGFPFKAPRLGVVAERGVFVHPHVRYGRLVSLPKELDSWNPGLSLLNLLEMVERLVDAPEAPLEWGAESAPYHPSMRNGISGWAPELHVHFPPSARQSVLQFHLVLRHLGVRLPRGLRHLVCQWITGDYVRELMEAAVTFSPLLPLPSPSSL